MILRRFEYDPPQSCQNDRRLRLLLELDSRLDELGRMQVLSSLDQVVHIEGESNGSVVMSL